MQTIQRVKMLTILDLQGVASFGESSGKVWISAVESTVELAEGRQGSGSHPNHKVLVLVAVVIRILWVQIVDVFVPVGWMQSSVEH